jgi:hypothetical protein
MRSIAVVVLLLAGPAGCVSEQPAKAPEAAPTTPPAAAAPAVSVSPPAANPGSAPVLPDPPAGAVAVAVDQPGSLTLPLPGLDGDEETHTRHSWKMPAGKGSALAVVRWLDGTWKDVKVDVGVGICPHRGKTLATATASGGLAVVRYDAEAGAPADDPNWFLHVNADANQGVKTGETLAYTYSIHAW